MDHIFTTFDCRNKFGYSRVSTASISNHMMLIIEWSREDKKRQPRWKIQPTTLHKPAWKTMIVEDKEMIWRSDVGDAIKIGDNSRKL